MPFTLACWMAARRLQTPVPTGAALHWLSPGLTSGRSCVVLTVNVCGDACAHTGPAVKPRSRIANAAARVRGPMQTP